MTAAPTPAIPTTVSLRVTIGRVGWLAVLLAAVGWLLVGTAPPVKAAAKPSAVVNLTTDGWVRGCWPTVQHLAATADFAFAGTVIGIADDVVTLNVMHVYKGTKADEVRVDQTLGITTQILGTGRFEAGKTYLVASSDGAVLTCGYSGEANMIGSPQSLYDKAF
jgi:hypothetical protein